jgi:hypothetical protein
MNAGNPVQIDLSGASATRTKDTRLAEHTGGSRVSGGARSRLGRAGWARLLDGDGRPFGVAGTGCGAVAGTGEAAVARAWGWRGGPGCLAAALRAGGGRPCPGAVDRGLGVARAPGAA